MNRGGAEIGGINLFLQVFYGDYRYPGVIVVRH